MIKKRLNVQFLEKGRMQASLSVKKTGLSNVSYLYYQKTDLFFRWKNTVLPKNGSSFFTAKMQYLKKY